MNLLPNVVRRKWNGRNRSRHLRISSSKSSSPLPRVSGCVLKCEPITSRDLRVLHFAPTNCCSVSFLLDLIHLGPCHAMSRDLRDHAHLSYTGLRLLQKHLVLLCGRGYGVEATLSKPGLICCVVQRNFCSYHAILIFIWNFVLLAFENVTSPESGDASTSRQPYVSCTSCQSTDEWISRYLPLSIVRWLAPLLWHFWLKTANNAIFHHILCTLKWQAYRARSQQ